jgi:RimJ/RimL family protein N-acetyltransferase
MIDVALERVPDDPSRVDTRGMLLSGRATVSFPPQPEAVADGFVVCVPDASLVSIVGRPPRSLIQQATGALDGHINVLCQLPDAAHVARALTTWLRTMAVVHTLRQRPNWADGDDGDTRIFWAHDAPTLTHVPPPLRVELMDALRGRTTARYVAGELPDRDVPPPLEPLPMAAAWFRGMPVAFCYPVFRTERWWDVSIETLEDYKRLGHGGRAVRAMTRYMWTTGRWPVWGAALDNVASLGLARSLGFQEVGRLCVFSGDAEQP